MKAGGWSRIPREEGKRAGGDALLSGSYCKRPEGRAEWGGEKGWGSVNKGIKNGSSVAFENQILIL